MSDTGLPLPEPVRHVFSIDVEEYFHVQAFEPYVDVQTWAGRQSRVEAGMETLLSLLADRGHTCTCFIVGWLAERQPQLVRRIAEAGHEVASHGYWHRRVDGMQPAQFREDLRRSKCVLEDVTGTVVEGFRAPSFSVSLSAAWMFEVMVEEGFRYDSSVFPARRPVRAIPDRLKRPFTIDTASGALIELPLTTLTTFGLSLPAAGGNYLRQLPAALVAHAVRQYERDETSAMLYVHPWEVDADQPRLPVPAITRMRHYRGLRSMQSKLETILGHHAFGSVRNVYPQHFLSA